jgi:hypothetical protein
MSCVERIRSVAIHTLDTEASGMTTTSMGVGPLHSMPTHAFAGRCSGSDVAE